VPEKVVHIAGVMAKLDVFPARPAREKDLYWSLNRLPCVHAVKGQELQGVAGAPPVKGLDMQI